MKLVHFDAQKMFFEEFNTETGYYERSGTLIPGLVYKDSLTFVAENTPGAVCCLIVQHGKEKEVMLMKQYINPETLKFSDPNGENIVQIFMDSQKDPFMANYPNLIDIGIMAKCSTAHLCKVGCYQGKADENAKNMSLDDFKRIIDESKGKVFQVALGGRGNPDEHENFEEMIAYCQENQIVPNFTTSGLTMNKEKAELCKKYCGAVAVSWHNTHYTMAAILDLLDAGVMTNIHYVLSASSIEDATRRIKDEDFVDGINAVVFLLHKPVGLGNQSDVLKATDPRVAEFYAAVEQHMQKKDKFKIGFDSCNIPGILNFTKNIDRASIDTCEGGRWSMYISADMIAFPCSFDNQRRVYAFDIKEKKIADAWNSDGFNNFREALKRECPGCPHNSECRCGCPLEGSIVLCNREEKIF